MANAAGNAKDNSNNKRRSDIAASRARAMSNRKAREGTIALDRSPTTTLSYLSLPSTTYNNQHTIDLSI